MSRRRRIDLLATALISASAILAASGAASARVHHHRHVRLVHETAPHGFVYRAPQDAARAAAIGRVDAFLGGTGIPGPTTADPYERPAYGYDEYGRYGPGRAYPGYALPGL